MTEKERPKLKKRPNKGGRPRIEDVTEFTPEMEDVAHLIWAGFTDPEISDRLGCSTEKVARWRKNERIRNRVARLSGDFLTEVGLQRQRLWLAGIEDMIKRAKEGKLSVKELDDILVRYDPYERLPDLATPETRRLLTAGKAGKVVGSNVPGNEAKQLDGGTFDEMEMGEEEDEE